MKHTRKAFTMIELVFVIVILGVLASIAVSKMAVTRDDAMIVKGKSQVSAIRSAITLQRSMKMMSGKGANPTHLDALSDAQHLTGNLFDYDTNSSTLAANNVNKLLDYPIAAKDANGHWVKTSADKYIFKVMNVDVNFTYTSSNGSFDCTHGTDTPAKKYCKALTE